MASYTMSNDGVRRVNLRSTIRVDRETHETLAAIANLEQQSVSDLLKDLLHGAVQRAIESQKENPHG